MLFRQQSFVCTSSAASVLPKLSSRKHENWWVVYKVNPEMDTCRYDEYVERYEDDDDIHVYKEEIEGHQSFTVSDGAGLIELATRDVELMEEEPGPSKKHI
jgi:hypothetical protein